MLFRVICNWPVQLPARSAYELGGFFEAAHSLPWFPLVLGRDLLQSRLLRRRACLADQVPQVRYGGRARLNVIRKARSGKHPLDSRREYTAPALPAKD